jgi:hypothetical protein
MHICNSSCCAECLRIVALQAKGKVFAPLEYAIHENDKEMVEALLDPIPKVKKHLEIAGRLKRDELIPDDVDMVDILDKAVSKVSTFTAKPLVRL